MKTVVKEKVTGRTFPWLAVSPYGAIVMWTDQHRYVTLVEHAGSCLKVGEVVVGIASAIEEFMNFEGTLELSNV